MAAACWDAAAQRFGLALQHSCFAGLVALLEAGGLLLKGAHVALEPDVEGARRA